MTAKKSDPLAVALDMIERGATGGTQGKIVALFGDRPDVLDAIVRARRDRKLSYQQIAKVLSADGEPISAGAVQSWLSRQGIG